MTTNTETIVFLVFVAFVFWFVPYQKVKRDSQFMVKCENGEISPYEAQRCLTYLLAKKAAK